MLRIKIVYSRNDLAETWKKSFTFFRCQHEKQARKEWAKKMEYEKILQVMVDSPIKGGV